MEIPKMEGRCQQIRHRPRSMASSSRGAERIVLLHSGGDEVETLAILSIDDEETYVSLPISAGTEVKWVEAGEMRFLGEEEVDSDRLHPAGVVELALPAHAVAL